MSASIVQQIWGPPVLEHIGAPNLIRQSLSGGEYPTHLHIDVLRHQLYELMFEAMQNNNPSLLEFATSKLDEYASSGAPVTDTVVRSTAYMAHALNMPFASQYAKYTSEHQRKSLYFATVLEKTLNLPNLDLFDHLCAVRHQYGFTIENLDNSKSLSQSLAFKMARVLTSRNEMKRLTNFSELYNWCMEKTTNSVFIERMMCDTAQSGALEAFSWIMDQFKESKFSKVPGLTPITVRLTCNACIKNNHINVFEHLFESLPQHRKYMFDRLDDFDNKSGLSVLVANMHRLQNEDLIYLVEECSPSTTSDMWVKEHATNILQRRTLEQHIPSSHPSARRKV